AWLKCKYMREHLGEEFSGMVSAATSFGIFVTLDAMYVEGLVHITELGEEYFRFDEARQELRGERTGTRYAIGTRVRVQVSRVDLDGRRIDFRLVPEGGAQAPARSKAGKASRPAETEEAGAPARGRAAKAGGARGGATAHAAAGTPSAARAAQPAAKAGRSGGKAGGKKASASQARPGRTRRS
ncbi:S1 RNA-binding domain-containing protein, partial [Comamonas granuli]|uniref:S1 RNA-binding domain-containing protein n=1 Tax=Comamonas granuli TaxID=290309 RepID=UPI0005A8E244